MVTSPGANPITGEPANGSDQKCILVLSEPATDPIEPAETRVVATTVFGAQNIVYDCGGSCPITNLKLLFFWADIF